MINKSLIYLKDGKKIMIDDTLLNRIKARLRGFKFVRKVFYGVELCKSKDGK